MSRENDRLNSKEVRVLIVDDDPMYVRFWKRIIAEMGVSNVHSSTNPEEAKKMITAEPYDVLISDVVMPGSNGYELAECARKANPSCKVVLTTGYSAYLAKFDLLRPRFHLLHKPYASIDEVGKFIRHLISNDESFEDMDENSFSENEDYPEVTEWKL